MKSKKSKLVQICEGVINTSSHDLRSIERQIGTYLADGTAVDEFHKRAINKMDEIEDQIDDIILEATHELAADAVEGNTEEAGDELMEVMELVQEYMHKLVAARFANK